jgi:hypothetical protein
VWKKLTQLTVSYNAKTVSTVEEVQQIYQQTTRSRQKTARRPVAKSSIARSTEQSSPLSNSTQAYKIEIDWRTM